MIIDAHQHVWNAGYPWLADPQFAAIHRDYTFDDLRPHLAATGVEATVLVEASLCSSEETREFLALAASTPEIAGVVGWASLTDPQLLFTLASHQAGPGGHLLRGVRDQVQQYEVDYLDQPQVRKGLAHIAAAGLVNELVVRCDQLPSVVRAAEALPTASFVLDHLGKPRVAAGADGLREWREVIVEVAQCPNVVAKVSGLVAEADWARWRVADLAPFVETAVELFGLDRLIFGSDWPMCEVAGSYERVVGALETILGGRPANVFGGTAARIYGLEL